MPNTYAESKDLLYAIEKLSQIQNPNERQRQALAALQAKQSEAQREVGETSARYRGFAQGATFGLRDEAAGLIEGLTGDAPYREGYPLGRDVSRGKDVMAKEEFPAEYSKGVLAGAGASSAIPFGIASKAPAGATLAQKTMAGAKAGGLTSFMQGFGRGEGFFDRLKEGGQDAIIGAGLGAGSQLAAHGVGSLAKYAAGGGDMIQGLSPRASSKLVSAVKQHAAGGGEDIGGYLSSLGAEGMLADVPGPLQSRAVGLASMPGEGGTQLSKAIQDRAKTASQRITRAATGALGDAGDAAATRAAQAARRSDVGSPLYQAALSHQGAIDAPDTVASMKAASKAAGPTTRRALAPFIDDLGDGTSVTAERLHGLRSDLSDAAEVARRAGNNKQALILGDALGAIDNKLDAVPGYSDARKVWAETFEVEDALDAGRKALAGGAASAQSPSDMVSMFDAMKPDQRDAFRKGVREYVASVMGTARNDVSAAKGLLNKGWNREKLASVIGSDEADELFRVIDAEDVFTQTKSAVTGGSQTAFRQEAAADLADIRAPDTLQRPGPLQRAKIGVDEASNAIVDALMAGKTQAANADIGRVLSMQGAERDAIVEKLIQSATTRQASPRKEAAMRAVETIIFALGQGGQQALGGN